MKVVLVVDDTPANIDVAKGILGGLYKIKVATSGEKALKIAQKDPGPDLILLDVMMPDMDGYQTCEQLKANSVTACIPVIFVTGNIDNKDREKALALGALDFISKPIDPEKLIRSIKSALDE
jgi:CheY-like chemotaxis protein